MCTFEGMLSSKSMCSQLLLLSISCHKGLAFGAGMQALCDNLQSVYTPFSNFLPFLALHPALAGTGAVEQCVTVGSFPFS